MYVYVGGELRVTVVQSSAFPLSNIDLIELVSIDVSPTLREVACYNEQRLPTTPFTPGPVTYPIPTNPHARFNSMML